MRRLLLAALLPAGLALGAGLSGTASAATISEGGLHAPGPSQLQHVYYYKHQYYPYYYNHRYYKHRRWDKHHRHWYYY